MSVFDKLAVPLAVLTAFGSPALGKDEKGAPTQLIGKYGANPEECRSYNRKSDGITIISERDFSFCGGSGCWAEVLSHKKTRDGYSLRLRSPGNPDGFNERFVVTDPSYIVEIDGNGKGKDLTLARCTRADAIAGIGRKTGPENH
jgi:hypothetical protein